MHTGASTYTGAAPTRPAPDHHHTNAPTENHAEQQRRHLERELEACKSAGNASKRASRPPSPPLARRTRTETARAMSTTTTLRHNTDRQQPRNDSGRGTRRQHTSSALERARQTLRFDTTRQHQRRPATVLDVLGYASTATAQAHGLRTQTRSNSHDDASNDAAGTAATTAPTHRPLAAQTAGRRKDRHRADQPGRPRRWAVDQRKRDAATGWGVTPAGARGPGADIVRASRRNAWGF